MEPTKSESELLRRIKEIFKEPSFWGVDNMKRLEARLSSISQKYLGLVPIERVSERLGFIDSLVKLFVKHLERDLGMIGDSLELERSIPGLVNFAYSYFYDIERHKDL